MSYQDLKALIGNSSRLLRRSDSVSIYEVRTSTPPPFGLPTTAPKKGLESDWSKHPLVGTLEVATDASGQPYVRTLYLGLERPIGSFLSTRLKRIDMAFSFSPTAHDGAMVTTSFSVIVDMRSFLFIHQLVQIKVLRTNFAIDAAGKHIPVALLR